jgi:prefoldin alpha subunit
MEAEMIMRAQQIEQEAKEIEQNLEIVTQQISELSDFKKTLEDFDSAKDKEMLSSLGKGVYAKTEVKDKELFVSVGAGVIVKKSPKETLKVIEEQVRRLKEVKMQLDAKGQAYAYAFQQLLMELQEAQTKARPAKSTK